MPEAASRPRPPPIATASGSSAALFERNPRPLWVFDRDSQAFLAVNNAAVRHYGFAREEFLALTIADIQPPDEQPIVDQLIDEATARGSAQAGPIRHRKKDGSTIDVEVVWNAVNFHGRSAFLVLVQDVTERLRDLAELQRAKHEAEAARSDLEQFLAVLSHELRTPLSPVLPAVSSLLDANPPAHARPVLEMIHRNVELQARLIDDLLDVVRAEHGKLRLERDSVDLNELIGQVVEICRPEIDAARVHLRFDLDADRDHVQADPARLQQVLWNLIKNALKFTPAGGTIRVTTRNAPDPASEDNPPRLLVTVADTGAGIAREDLERIFEPFEQGRSRAGGLGLGLAISRSIAEAHGARLRAASDGPGRGSRFTLDMATEPTTAEILLPTVAPTPAESRPLKILLVDDNEDVLNYFALALSRRGHAVTIAEDLTSALEAADAARFDLLISDLELPDGSGLDLMRTLPRLRFLARHRPERLRLR